MLFSQKEFQLLKFSVAKGVWKWLTLKAKHNSRIVSGFGPTVSHSL